MGHGLRQHLDVQQRRARMGAGRLQRRQQGLLVVHPPRAAAVALRILREVDLHQRTVKPSGFRIAMAVFRAKAAHAVPHLQVVNAAEAGVIKQQNGDLNALLNGGLQLGVQHHVGAIPHHGVYRLLGAGKLRADGCRNLVAHAGVAVLQVIAVRRFDLPEAL